MPKRSTVEEKDVQVGVLGSDRVRRTSGVSGSLMEKCTKVLRTDTDPSGVIKSDGY